MDITKDQVKGRLKEAEGKINEVAGKVAGDKKLEVKGKVQTIGGEAQAKLGDVRQEVKAALKKASGRGVEAACLRLPAASVPAQKAPGLSVHCESRRNARCQDFALPAHRADPPRSTHGAFQSVSIPFGAIGCRRVGAGEEIQQGVFGICRI